MQTTTFRPVVIFIREDQPSPKRPSALQLLLMVPLLWRAIGWVKSLIKGDEDLSVFSLVG